jgi:hypothetical protein
MEVTVRSTVLDVEYELIPGEKEVTHDGTGGGYPGSPDIIEVKEIHWTSSNGNTYEVYDLISELGLMEEVETAVYESLD